MHKRVGKPDFINFQLEKSYKVDRAYGLSKLYLIWISRQFVQFLKENNINNVTVNICHPDAAATNFGQDSDKGFLINIIFKLALLFLDKLEKGAITSIYLASSPEVEGLTGEFFGNRNNIEKPSNKYWSKENGKIVWYYSINIINK